MSDDTAQIKRVAIIMIVFLLVFGVGLYLFRFVSLATITVSSSAPNSTVSITPVVNGVAINSKALIGENKISKRVKAGGYKLEASSKSFSANQVVNVKSRQKLNVELNPVKATVPEPVYGSSVSSLLATSSKLVFLDGANLLSRIAPDGSPPATLFGKALYGLKWTSSGQGLARDGDNQLYSVTEGGVGQIALPFRSAKSTIFTYAGTSNGAVYVSNGRAIYKATSGGKFKQIFATKNTINALSANNDVVAAIESPEGKNPDNAGEVILVGDSGETAHKDLDSNQISWSPNGKYLLVADEASAQLLDTNLNHVAQIAAVGTSSYGWGSNSSLYYSTGGTLWTYNADNRQSQRLAETASQAPINGVFPDVEEIGRAHV